MTKKIEFREFANWLKEGDSGEWPDPFGHNKKLTPVQTKIVKENSELLTNRTRWEKKVIQFEEALNNAKNAYGGTVDKFRREFEIRFDQHRFSTVKIGRAHV